MTPPQESADATVARLARALSGATRGTRVHLDLPEARVLIPALLEDIAAEGLVIEEVDPDPRRTLAFRVAKLPVDVQLALARRIFKEHAPGAVILPAAEVEALREALNGAVAHAHGREFVGWLIDRYTMRDLPAVSAVLSKEPLADVIAAGRAPLAATRREPVAEE